MARPPAHLGGAGRAPAYTFPDFFCGGGGATAGTKLQLLQQKTRPVLYIYPWTLCGCGRGGAGDSPCPRCACGQQTINDLWDGSTWIDWGRGFPVRPVAA